MKAEATNVKITEQYAVSAQTRKYNGLHLLKHALQNTSPDITKTVLKWVDGERREVKVRDGEAIQLANSKIDEIRGAFPEWLREQSSDFKDRLTDLYNRTFNCYVRPKYDGTHQEFPDLDLKGLGIDNLYDSQKDAIWMDKLLGGGIIDHEVGGGKTLIMCCGAYEKKRLGLANKPMIIGLKANIHEIARTFCTAYPMAKVLYPGKEDFTPRKRERIFREIRNNDWDAVILSHEQFGMIPQSPEIQQEILQAELDCVEENLEVLKAQGRDVSRAMMKGCQKRKANLEAKLQKVAHALETRKDDAVDFRLMGIDHLYVDESHKFKNLTFTTRHDRVAGLGNPEGSQRALNMLFALRTIQQRTGRDLGGDVPLGNDHLQLAHGTVPAFQVPAPEGTGASEYPHLRCLGGHICQENHRLRVFRDQRGRAERTVPIFHQGSRTGHVLLRDYRLPIGGGYRDRPTAKERDIAQYPADTPADGVHRTAGAVRQIGRCHAPGPPAALGAGGKGENAHCHRLRPQDVARYAYDRPRTIQRPRGQQGEPLRPYDCRLLPPFRGVQRYAVRILRPGNLQTRSGVERLFRDTA